MNIITEEILENQSIEWFKELGYKYKNGSDLINSEPVERTDLKNVILEERLVSKILDLNPIESKSIITKSILDITNPNSPNLLVNNRTLHEIISKGLDVSFMKNNPL